MAALAIAIPVTLSGKDASGVEFTEKTRTAVIDRRGGKIATKCDLTLGSEMTLHNLIVGQTARVRVVWVGEKRSAKEPREVGVQLLESKNFWGIDFPSYDRKKSPLQASRLKIPSSRTAAPAASSPGPSAALKYAVPDAGSSLRPGKTSRPAASLAAASVQTHQPSPPPVAGATPAPTVEESNASIGATLNRLIEQMETAGEDEARLFREKAEEFSRSSSLPGRTNLPEAAKNFEEINSYVEGQVKRLEGGLQACRTEMQQLVTELEELKHAVKDEMGKTLRQVQESGHLISGTTIASAQAEIAQAWSKSAVGFEAQLQKTVDEVAESAAKQMQKQAEDALLLLGEELETSGNDCIKRLEESLAKAEGERQRSALSGFGKALEQKCAEALARMKCDLAQPLQDVTEQAARQASALNDLRKAVEEESLQTLANVKAAATQAIGEVSGQIERQANALKELCGEVQEESARTLTQAKSEATQSIRGVSEQVGRDLEALNNLRNSLVEESVQALPKFQQHFEAVMGEVAGQVQEQVKMLCSLLSLIEKQSAQVFSQVKNKVAQALAESSLLAEQHIKEAAGNIEQNWFERIQGKQQQAADAILEAAAARLSKQLEENLELFGEELKLKQEQAASGAAQAFRSKIVEMLSVFQSPASSFTP